MLYDVTSLFFEVQKESEYRKPGLSKERRLEPQIIIGLLVDINWFPLDLRSFEGNKTETKTVLLIIESFQAKQKLDIITVVADADMLSAANLSALTETGCKYMVVSRLNKIPYALSVYRKNNELLDKPIIVDQVTDCYHQLFHVEKAFRIAKTGLKARPIFHRERDSIEAHLTVVLASLAIVKCIELQTGISIRRFVNLLRPLRSAIIVINGHEIIVEPETPKLTTSVLSNLSPVH